MKKYLAIILCVILLMSFPLRSTSAHAITPGLMITGSTIINSSVMSAILSIVAQAMGLDGNIKSAMQNTSENLVTSYIGGLLSEYATRIGSNVGAFYEIINEGMRYTSDGAITFDDVSSQFLGDFFSWAHSEDGGNLQQYDELILGDTNTIDYSNVDTSSLGFTYNAPIIVANSVTIYPKKSGPSNSTVYTASGTSVVLFCRYGGNLWLYSLEPFSVYANGNLVYNSSKESDYGLIYNFKSVPFNESNYVFSIESSTNGKYRQTAYMIFNGTLTGGSNVDTNIFDFPESNPDNYDTNVIYPNDIITLPDFGSGATGIADIGSYLGAVSDTIYAGGGSLSVEDSEGVSTDYSVSSSGVESMQRVQTSSATLDETVGGTTSAVGSGTVQGELGDYTLDLRDFFPFCIPFDIYRMLSLFAASREAPNVEWRFFVPGIVDETIEIDLSVFDNVAATLRTVELIAAAIGLAFVTKKLIQGGD